MSKRSFLYVCADPGIPVPGTKGASIHVASLCRALRQIGLTGEVLAQRAKADAVEELRLQKLARPASPGETAVQREVRLFLSQEIDEDGLAPFDFVYERYSLWHAGGLRLARRRGVPFVLEVNSPLPVEASRFRSLRYTGLAEGIADVLMSQADLVVAVSEEVADWVRGLRGTDEGVAVVPNGVDEERFEPRDRRRPELPAAPVPLIGFSGSFRPWHDLAVLVQAFAQVCERLDPAPHLVLVGDGPTAPDVRHLARDLGVEDRITFTGAVAHAEVAEWIGTADVAVCPYPDDPTFYFSPLKLYEFLALGLPVVASNIGQVTAAIPDGERGVLVEPGSATALADGIARVLGDLPAARRLARAAREWVLENATWKGRAREILAAVDAVS